jgi:hypothetical protein
MNKAKFVSEITVVDPDTGGDVQIEVYKHENGGMFAIDSSYLEQTVDDDSNPVIPDPFSTTKAQELMLFNNDAIHLK